MTHRVLVGCSPDERGDDALVLAALVARATGAAVTAANVHPPPWPARGPGSVDAEWLAPTCADARTRSPPRPSGGSPDSASRRGRPSRACTRTGGAAGG
ncbi:hypothetical protein [Actinomadura sp. CNU-125]|uniref:hypothetical protein n=1 Tax=Actinomadura sp. CNU-125 TaxID=1904961 RepID=UPI0021CC7600|nr:hypothetical protein [Actinomadura sp. CNU-125]